MVPQLHSAQLVQPGGGVMLLGEPDARCRVIQLIQLAQTHSERPPSERPPSDVRNEPVRPRRDRKSTWSESTRSESTQRESMQREHNETVAYTAGGGDRKEEQADAPSTVSHTNSSSSH